MLDFFNFWHFASFSSIEVAKQIDKKMKSHKSLYFSICKFLIKLLPFIIGCFLSGCGEHKKAKQVLLNQNLITSSESAINM